MTVALAEDLARRPHFGVGLLLHAERAADLVHDVVVGGGGAAAHGLVARIPGTLLVRVEVSAREHRGDRRFPRHLDEVTGVRGQDTGRSRVRDVRNDRQWPAVHFPGVLHYSFHDRLLDRTHSKEIARREYV